MLLREESMFLLGKIYPLHVFKSHTPSHTQTDTHLCVQHMCACEAAVQEHGLKLLGEDECVWTERISAERRLPEISQALHFTQTAAL